MPAIPGQNESVCASPDIIVDKEKQYIKELALQVGFDLVGIAEAKNYPETAYFEKWLNLGYAADMHYLARRRADRVDPQRILPDAKSVIVCGLLYNTRKERSIDADFRQRAWISRYAWARDYHTLVQEILSVLVEKIQTKLGREIQHRAYVDTGPVLERVFAYHAGLGWFGRNSCLIHPRLGSYFFLGVIFTDLPLPSDSPMPERCGDCMRCLEACPTGAIVSPKMVDSRKCISFQTIENRGTIPGEIMAKMGNRVFGCDVCQEVCPWNRKAPLTKNEGFLPRPGFFAPDFAELLRLVLQGYPKKFIDSPLKRAKQKGLLRNVLIAMGNSGHLNHAEYLRHLRFDDPELAKLQHWAIRKLV